MSDDLAGRRDRRLFFAMRKAMRECMVECKQLHPEMSCEECITHCKEELREEYAGILPDSWDFNNFFEQIKKWMEKFARFLELLDLFTGEDDE